MPDGRRRARHRLPRGAGPGDPGLLTVRGRELLATCDAIAADALANPAIVAAARADEPARRGARGGEARRQRRVGQPGRHQRAARAARARGKARRAAQGRRPARVRARQRGGAGARARRASPFEIVPGVTAGVAAPAYAGIPVTHRGVATSVTFVTGHEDPAKPETQTDWAALARAGGTIVLYMGVKTLPRIAAALVAGGHVARHAGRGGAVGHARAAAHGDGHCRHARRRHRARGLAAPVITVIGDVVALRDEIAWFDRRPLFGQAHRRDARLRAGGRAARRARRARRGGARAARAARGADRRPAPARTRAVAAPRSTYDWVVLTSQNAVRDRCGTRCAPRGSMRARCAGVRIACVGKLHERRAARARARGRRRACSGSWPKAVLEALRRARRRARLARAVPRRRGCARRAARRAARARLRRWRWWPPIAPWRAATDADALREALEGRHGGRRDLRVRRRRYVATWRPSDARLATRAPAVSIGPVTTEAVRAAGIPLGRRGRHGVDRRPRGGHRRRGDAPRRRRVELRATRSMRILHDVAPHPLPIPAARPARRALRARARRLRRSRPAACATSSRLARDLWKASGITSYHATISRECYCAPEIARAVTIVVRNGVVHEPHLRGHRRRRGTRISRQEFPTVDALFTILEDARGASGRPA